MIRVRRSDARGHASHGWLDTHYTFSFANYFDRSHMGFRVLRVMNEDWIRAGKGFGTHAHDNMEIISYVVSGELEHKDSMGNGSVIQPGEFQIITAGTGITHSEFNPSKTTDTHLYQIWLLPDERGLKPTYQQRSFAASSGNAGLQLVASKTGEEGSLLVNQDVKLYRGVLAGGSALTLPLSHERYGWVQVVKGDVEIEDEALTTGDGAALTEAAHPVLRAKGDAEFLLFDLP